MIVSSWRKRVRNWDWSYWPNFHYKLFWHEKSIENSFENLRLNSEKNMGWHPQKYQCNHFIHSWSVLLDQNDSETEDNAIDRTFTLQINCGSINRIEMVSPFSSWVFSFIFEHWFLLIMKSPKLKKCSDLSDFTI